MTVYNAKEMYELAQSKSQSEQEKEKVMEQIHKAASVGLYYTMFLCGDFEDYRLIIAWLCNLGYRCVSDQDKFPRVFYVKWE